MLKPNPLAFCAAAALIIGLMSGCGGGGNDEKIPDLATEGGRVEEPQIPIRNAALLAGLRTLPPIPAELQEDHRGFNAVLHLLMHNPTWSKKVINGKTASRFKGVEEYLSLLHFINAFQTARDLEKPYERLIKSLKGPSADEEKKNALFAELGLEPVAVDAIHEGLKSGQTVFVIDESDKEKKDLPFDQLPVQARIIGFAVGNGNERVAYLKKGEHWFGTNDEKFTKVNIDYINQLGKDKSGATVFAVSYSAA